MFAFVFYVDCIDIFILKSAHREMRREKEGNTNEITQNDQKESIFRRFPVHPRLFYV